MITLWISCITHMDFCFTKNSNRQVTTCVECCCTLRHRHLKVCPQPGQILRDELRWLNLPDQLFFELAVTVHRCSNSCAPLYLLDYCVPATIADARWHLHSADCQLVPRYRLNTYRRRSFSVACPTVWNFMRDFIPRLSMQTFRCLLKTYLFA